MNKRVASLVEALCGENIVARLSAMVTVSPADAPAVPLLCEILMDRTRPWSVRWAVASALGRIGARAAVPSLLEVTKDNRSSGDEWVRYGAIQALTRYREPQAVPYLIDRLSDTTTPADFWPENRICDVAAGALARIDCHEARAAVQVWRTWHRNRLVDPHPALRLTAAIALAFVGDGAGRNVLLDYMANLPMRAEPALAGFDVYQVEKAIEALRDAPIPPELEERKVH